MSDSRVTLRRGERVLLRDGMALIIDVHRLGVVLRSANLTEHTVPYTDLGQVTSPGQHVSAVTRSLGPWWTSRTSHQQAQILRRLEAVLTVLTGFADGSSEAARSGEPEHPFGPDSDASLTIRCRRMAELLTLERRADRQAQRDGLAERRVGDRTVMRWVQSFQADGVMGLDDQRSTRREEAFSSLPPELRVAISDVVSTFDGDISAVTQGEVLRRALELLKDRGLEVSVPQRRTREYVSWLMKERGSTTRGHASHGQRRRSGYRGYPAVFPGQLVSVDATRADVIVFDPRTRSSVSVEIITAVDVATRVVLAVRVVPRSATALDVCLLLYDVMRPFTMTVDGGQVGDWVWAGVPEAIDLASLTTRDPAPVVHVGDTLQGTHHVPAVTPVALRSDHGANFRAVVLQEQLRRLQIDQMPSRVGRPLDNNTVERLHDTYRRALQQLGGYKGRNTTERGRRAGVVGAHAREPLLTAAGLERHLRRFVTLDYNARPHTGLHVPGAPGVAISPLEMFDQLLRLAGRIHVPQHPDLLYDFLPVRWLTVRQSGVEFHNLTYDGPALDGLRRPHPGQFRSKDAAMAFFHDPRDWTRLWFRHPETGTIEVVPWRNAHLTQAPFADKVATEVLRRARDHPRADLDAQILTELGSLTTAAEMGELKAQVAAAGIRHDAARRDHDDARVAADRAATAQVGDDARHLRLLPAPTPADGGAPDGNVDIWADEWPDLSGEA